VTAQLVRKSRILEVADVIDRVQDGATIGVGGFINAGHPMAFVREIIRQGKKDLVLVGAASAGLEVDMLLAAGCVRQVISPYVGAEGLAGIGPAFRKLAQDGAVDVFELDEAHFYAGLRASSQRLPFSPWRAGVGTSLPEVNPELKLFRDPVNDELLIAVPAIEIDVCLLHAAISDAFGNVQHNGTRYGDVAMSAASSETYVTVEQVVSTERIKAMPGLTSIAGADGVVRAQFGAHPFSSHGYYVPDREHIRDYLRAATTWLSSGDRSELDRYFTRFVHEATTHADYLERVGMHRLLSLHEF
jgi:glutaconate CoA-transferase subunit A